MDNKQWTFTFVRQANIYKSITRQVTLRLLKDTTETDCMPFQNMIHAEHLFQFSKTRTVN